MRHPVTQFTDFFAEPRQNRGMQSLQLRGLAGPTLAGTAQVGALTTEERQRIARHAEREVADRMFRELCERAELAQAEYRFTDMMDRYALVLAAGMVLLLLACLELAAVVSLWVEAIQGYPPASGATCSWLVIGGVLTFFISGLLLLYLRRQVMGRHWLRSETRLPWTMRG